MKSNKAEIAVSMKLGKYCANKLFGPEPDTKKYVQPCQKML